MKYLGLDRIGFYSLSDYRAKTASVDTPLQRCELILTDRCNFRCSYCRGLRSDIKGDISLQQALKVLDLWTKDNLRCIRFSGGEPTLYPYLEHLITFCKRRNIEKIAISTNGSAKLSFYKRLIELGVNDFSISLDACCAALGDKISGISGSWQYVTKIIESLSKETYVSIGMVFNESNINSCVENVLFASSLGVSDIRIIPSAQYNQVLKRMAELPKEVLDRHPILKYRIENLKLGRHVRGICKEDSHYCPLVLDDMVIAKDKHFPCVIYMREQGDPIGLVGPHMRKEREKWFKETNVKQNPICRFNCLDCLVDYNNIVMARIGKIL